MLTSTEHIQLDTLTRQDSSERAISSSQIPPPTQHTNMHTLNGIWIHNPSKRAILNLRYRPQGHLISGHPVC